MVPSNNTRHVSNGRVRLVAALASPLIAFGGLAVIASPAQAAVSSTALASVDDSLETFRLPDPTLDRSPVVGKPITASIDLSEAPAGAEVVSWQWKGPREPSWTCETIAGAVGPTYTPVKADYYQHLCLDITVRAPGYEDATWTGPVGIVGQGELPDTFSAAVDGQPRAGAETWAVEIGNRDLTDYYQYEWSIDGVTIEDAVQPFYTPTGHDVGHDLAVTVRAYSTGYEDREATSEPVEVQTGTLSIDEPTLSTSRPEVDSEVELFLELGYTPEDRIRTIAWGIFDGETCAPIEDTDYRWFTPRIDEIGKRLCVTYSVSAIGFETFEGMLVTDPVVGGALPVDRAVLNTSAPKVGTKLTASVRGGQLPDTAKQTVTWGYAAAGATCRPTKSAGSYAVTSAMVGRRVCAKVTVTAPGFDTWSGVVTSGIVKETARVTAPASVKGTKKFTVRVQGLAPGQRYRIVSTGIKVSGKADSYGRATRSVKFGKKVRAGKQTVTVQGLDARGKVTWVKKTKITHRR